MSSTAAAGRLRGSRLDPRALLDPALAALALGGTLAQLRHGGAFLVHPGSGQLDLTGFLLVAGSTVPIVGWRRWPVGTFVVTAAATAVLAGLGHSIDLVLGPTVALFLLAAGRRQDSRWTGRITAVVIGLFLAYLVATAAARPGFPGVELLHTGMAWAVAWFAGERTRLRREQVAGFRERAVRAERDAQRERLLAVAEERSRIARDLHDSAAHAISLIAVRAGAARLRHQRTPDRSLQALEAIETVARQTAGDIDQLVSSLRRDGSAGGTVEAPAGLGSLDTLIVHHAAAGLDVTLDRSGVPRPLGTAADQAAYRILQEALTNAARHGAGNARVSLAFGDAAIELTVTNPVSAGGEPRPGGGHGLIGMRERATLLDGSLAAERVNGTFRVHARLPYRSVLP